jgi:hypothetical protein
MASMQGRVRPAHNPKPHMLAEPLGGIYLNMKNIFLIILIFLLSCGTKKQPEQQSTGIKDADFSETLDSIIPVEQQIEHKTEEIPIINEYEFIDEPNSTRQTLTVKWITRDTIEFILFTETDLCDYEEYGTAVIKLQIEIDDDENEINSETSEYEIIDAGKLKSIRISEPEQDKAKIEYIYDQPRDECSPYDNLMKKTPPNN